MVLPDRKLTPVNAATDGASTRAVHGGMTGAVGEALGTQVVLTSSFVLENPTAWNVHHDYGRVSNETVAKLERQLCALEHSRYAPVFANGIAAENAIFSLLRSGDHIIFEDNTYGCTLRLIHEIFEKFGITISFLDFCDPTSLEKITSSKPTLIWIESPTNPLLKVIDIEAVTQAAHTVGSRVVVDNTFACPINQRPLELGADVVLYSLTKYHAGHSSCMGGAICTNDDLLAHRLYDIRRFNGSILSPSEAALVAQGVQTIDVRMERISRNALTIARSLESHELVSRVLYPGLESHPQHELAVRQMATGSGIVAVEFAIPHEALNEFILALNPYFVLSHSIGSTKSQISIPALMSHANLSPQERARIGLSDTLFRFSIGIEDVEDLLRTLREALKPYS